MIYEAGYKNPCDYASRHPDKLNVSLSENQKEDLGIEDEYEDAVFSVNRIIDQDIEGAVTKDLLVKETSLDPELRQLLVDVPNGRLSDQMLQSKYAQVFDEMTVCDGFLLKGDRVVIPPKLTEQVISLAHESHGLGETKTIRLLRQRVWFPKLAKKTKEYVSNCYPCAVAIPRNDPVPIVNRKLPSGPWREVAVDYKGPIGGPKGFYYHVVIDLYSRYPEICIVNNTSFESLRPKLEEIWARFGIPEKVIHDGGPPYNSHEWRAYAKEKGFNLELCTPEHPQSNGMAEKMMASLAKITHAAIAEGVKPCEVLSTFLMSYRSTPHGSTGKSPSQLLMKKELKTKIPCVDSLKEGVRDKSVEEIDSAEKAKHKKYADKRRRARESEIKVGDNVLVKQKKTTTRPPWDPNPYLVEKVQNSKIHLVRNGKVKIRNVEKCKLLKKKIRSRNAVVDISSDEEDDFDLDILRLGRNANASVINDEHVSDDEQSTTEDDLQQDDSFADAVEDFPQQENIHAEEREEDQIEELDNDKSLRRSNRVKLPPSRYSDYESWNSVRIGSPLSPRERKRRQADAKYKRNRPTN